MTATPEAIISDFVASTHSDDVPREAVDAAAVQVFDTLGVALAGAAQPAGRALKQTIRDFGEGTAARLIGSDVRTSAPAAAWANGSLAHLLDYDDSGFSHPTSCILPAALAVAEQLDASVDDFLVSMVVGYEVFERLSQSARSSEAALRRRGFHPTSIYGGAAAAAAAGSLLGLDARQVTTALSLAATDASGVTQQFGTWGKGVNAGNAARGGVVAAQLAANGYWADEEGLSGKYGLFAAFHGQNAYSFDRVGEEIGHAWAILDPGLAIKLYPACGINRRAVDAVLKIADEHPFEPADVEEVILHVQPAMFETLRFRAPTVGFRGKFSLDYTVACALLDGAVTIESYTDESARRPELRAMLSRITLVPHEEWAGERYREIPVELRLRGGEFHAESVPAPRGSRALPLTPDEIQAKFIDCASRSLGSERAERASEVVWAMRELAKVPGLVDEVVLPGDGERNGFASGATGRAD